MSCNWDLARNYEIDILVLPWTVDDDSCHAKLRQGVFLMLVEHYPADPSTSEHRNNGISRSFLLLDIEKCIHNWVALRCILYCHG